MLLLNSIRLLLLPCQVLSDLTRHQDGQVCTNGRLASKLCKMVPVTVQYGVFLSGKLLAQLVDCIFMLPFFTVILKYVLFHARHRNALTTHRR